MDRNPFRATDFIQTCYNQINKIYIYLIKNIYMYTSYIYVYIYVNINIYMYEKFVKNSTNLLVS